MSCPHYWIEVSCFGDLFRSWLCALCGHVIHADRETVMTDE